MVWFIIRLIKRKNHKAMFNDKKNTTTMYYRFEFLRLYSIKEETIVQKAYLIKSRSQKSLLILNHSCVWNKSLKKIVGKPCFTRNQKVENTKSTKTSCFFCYFLKNHITVEGLRKCGFKKRGNVYVVLNNITLGCTMLSWHSV